MEFQKIANFIDTTLDDKELPKFVTKNGLKFMTKQKKNNYSVNKEIWIERSILRSDLYDFSGAYIVVEGDIIVTEPDNAKRNKSVTFENNAPFINCI